MGLFGGTTGIPTAFVMKHLVPVYASGEPLVSGDIVRLPIAMMMLNSVT